MKWIGGHFESQGWWIVATMERIKMSKHRCVGDGGEV